jgi:hypothetical protein
MKRSILPSQSQVMSASTALRSGMLVQPVDRHDGEQLLDGPGVGQGLEDAEVAEVDIGERGLQVLQELVGNVLEPFISSAMRTMMLQKMRSASARSRRVTAPW